MPAAKKLDLRINELSTKRQWLASLSAMLRDARVLGAGRWDVRRCCYEVEFERVAFESRLWDGGRFEYSTVPCRLSILPVLGCVEGRASEISSWGIERVKGIELEDAQELVLSTDSGLTRLNLSRGASLDIRDLEAPRPSHTVADYGDLAIDPYRADEMFRLRVV
ncbi:MAG: hypothetical protein AAF725_07225 [Acidobacteriota bacterium]